MTMGTQMIPADRGYTEHHEWARRETDGVVTIGITDQGQSLMGDLVFVEAPAVGRHVDAGESCGVLESVKAAVDLHAPVSGVVVAVNGDLAAGPEALNELPWSTWIFRVRPDGPEAVDALLTARAYELLVD